MSAVDAPPGLVVGTAANEFAARPRARRLARAVLVYVTVAATLTLVAVSRRLHAPFVETLVALVPMCMSVALLGWAVRSARVRVDSGGVRWGWRIAGFRLDRERLVSVHEYRDAVALEPRRGSTWYLSARDWDRFAAIGAALRVARIPFISHDRRAPLSARLQSYGAVLDTLLVLDAVAITLALALALR
ncbi:MAG TPA: hypothetical protein VL172_06675 [Kofleriaceae bacterium]|jgi:hypothetical protein|nr:hypothetical protein [Kofleriaceae bacterium]